MKNSKSVVDSLAVAGIMAAGAPVAALKPFNHEQFKTCALRPEDSRPSPKKRRARFAEKTKKS